MTRLTHPADILMAAAKVSEGFGFITLQTTFGQVIYDDVVWYLHHLHNADCDMRRSLSGANALRCAASLAMDGEA